MHHAREAAERGEKEFQLLRFPSELCTDRGCAINADRNPTAAGQGAARYDDEPRAPRSGADRKRERSFGSKPLQPGISLRSGCGQWAALKAGKFVRAGRSVRAAGALRGFNSACGVDGGDGRTVGPTP